MYKCILLLLFLGAVALPVTAQNISVTGKISNASGQAISGAVVELINQGLKDTTGADGMYAFNGAVSVMHPGASGKNMTMAGGVLQIRLSSSASVKIEVYDIRGNLLKRKSLQNAAAGSYTWNVEEGLSLTGMLIIQASVGTERRTFRYLPIGLNGISESPATQTSALIETPLSKTGSAVDSIRVTAAGYAVTTMEVSSYSATVNVTLARGSTDRWGGPGNPPAPSAGCGKPQGITSGFKTINSGGRDREYVIDIPGNYDPNTPHLFFYVSHWINGRAASMRSNNYYRLKNEAEAANKPAIFLAATAIGGRWGEADHPLFDDIMAHVQENLCIDTTRVFATGYSYGGMYSYSLSTNHQHKIRAAVGMAPANYNIWIPNPKKPEPIAWMQVHGLQDELCRWVNNESREEGGKYIVLEKARNNGCDIPPGDNFPVWQSGPHLCYEFENCDEGYPVKICTNNGPHSGAESYKDPGQSTSWVHPTAWEFYMRF